MVKVIEYSTISDISAHLMEEISEVNDALCNLQDIDINHNNKKEKDSMEVRRDNFCSEIADVFSWIFALSRKSKYHIERSTPIGEERFFATSLNYTLRNLFTDEMRWGG